MSNTRQALRLLRLYFGIYVVTPLGVLFRLPGFMLFAFQLLLFKNGQEQKDTSSNMNEVMHKINSDDQLGDEQRKFMKAYSEKTLHLAYQFWIGVALIVLLIKYL